VLFDWMFDNLEVLCLYGGIIANTDHSITYNRINYEFLIATPDMSLNKL
jgi:hypothetical protein